jgi:hypothetical protein
MVARAPLEALPVGNLVWPSRLGALLPDTAFDAGRLRRHGIVISQEDGRTILRFGHRFAEAPRLDAAPQRMRHAWQASA